MADDKGRLEAELEIAGLVEQYSALRPTVEDASTRTPENMAEYRRLNDAIAALRTAYKEQYGPPPAEPGDAAPAPAPVEAAMGNGGSDT